MQELRIRASGYVTCRSGFYTALDILPEKEYTFSSGINRLKGEIDSGNWALSYLLSMQAHRPKDFIACEESEVTINGQVVKLRQLSQHTCYMDESYPLFAQKRSVRKLVVKGLEQSGRQQSADEIRRLFGINESHFERPVMAVGNTRFQAMAAIAYAYGKTIFCFPWMSQHRSEAFEGRLQIVLHALTELGMIVILPHS